jgi:hypothetical protein
MMKNVSEFCSAGGSPALAMPAEKTAVSEAITGNVHHAAMAHIWKIQKRENQGQRAAGATKTLPYHDFQGRHKEYKVDLCEGAINICSRYSARTEMTTEVVTTNVAKFSISFDTDRW